ncbi:cation diffusion facilitator family transporter [Pseudohoeflea coraliihabitans]|uniref:Cation diffusion facilitator family transporter n=1 Tax=Pseudohoeflea coraliihabitans TaxID=2860393 RepID=A0ABS6WPK6_9HYPH|nr:cation diffusion facilitator family transporter [Pseudohoeflea sp. DP4N28-3]MBW3097888.1 cation diffusion facilitator family transporter [Pseudohoeflea sp. DP4N28-3]
MAGHGHNHNHIDPDAGDARVLWAILVNLGLTVAQVVGGLLAGSLALIADALHNFSDAISLIIAFAARKIARKPADSQMTFGYGRAEVVAALINYTTLILIGAYLAYEAVMRFFDPQPVDGWLVVIIAVVALVVDLVTAALTFTMAKSSVNIRAAFLHNVADALGSVAVIVAGGLILLYDWRLIDPIATLLIAGYILWQAITEIGGVIRILMLGSPPDIDAEAVLADLRGIDGISGVHHLHLWQMQENEAAVDAHLVIFEGQWHAADAIKSTAKARLAEQFGIVHATFELECAVHACHDAPVIGHEGKGQHGHGHAFDSRDQQPGSR